MIDDHLHILTQELQVLSLQMKTLAGLRDHTNLGMAGPIGDTVASGSFHKINIRVLHMKYYSCLNSRWLHSIKPPPSLRGRLRMTTAPLYFGLYNLMWDTWFTATICMFSACSKG